MKISILRSQLISSKETPTLLLPDNVQVNWLDNGLVETSGLGDLDKKRRDLIEVVQIINPLLADFKSLNVFSPRTYLESLRPIPTHVTAQCIICHKVTTDTYTMIQECQKLSSYGKTDYDKFWVGKKTPEQIKNDDWLLVMNRRVGGWDGSVERPVIELLCAGGHIPAVKVNGKIQSMKPEDALRKELVEEVGYKGKSIPIKIGGFFNNISSELVILFVLKVDDSEIINMHNSALGNLEENIDGLYLGEISDVFDNYKKHADNFAGGEKARPTNFPSQSDLMKKLFNQIDKK